MIRLNYGVQRSERGALAVRTIALLPALVGSWKEVGGGLQLSTSQAFQLNRAGLERPDLQQKALGRPARHRQHDGARAGAQHASTIRR